MTVVVVTWKDSKALKQQVAGDLRNAARWIRRDGWYQGSWMSPDTNARCAAGAIGKATGAFAFVSSGLQEQNRYDRAFAALGVYLGRSDIGDWNDDVDRTVEDVLTALEKAALMVEEQVSLRPLVERMRA